MKDREALNARWSKREVVEEINDWSRARFPSRRTGAERGENEARVHESKLRKTRLLLI